MAQPSPAVAPQQKAPLSPAAMGAIREQFLDLIASDPEIQAAVRALAAAAPGREIGAAEASQIMDLIEKQVGALLDKRIERVVRSLVRPDYLLRPHLRPDAADHRP